MAFRLTTIAMTLLVATPSIRGMTLAASQQSAAGWTDVALKAANDFTVSQREKLRQEGALDIQRPIRIRGERVIGPASSDEEEDFKIIHFQRHGQGYHNLICDMWREELNKPVIDFESSDPALNPVVRPELLDPPLTHSGILQCKARRDECSRLTPELIVVSPLLRCLQTAKLSFRDHHPLLMQNKQETIPWIAHEGCREELGLLVGNKRRPLADLIEDYPDVDFSFVVHKEDVLWERFHGRRETLQEQSDRIYDFLTEFVANRPEREIAIVCHSAYLFTMLNAVMEVEDEALRSWFLTSEVRSIKVRFLRNEAFSTV